MSELYDVVILGGGPAGLTAAIYLTRAKYRVLVLEKEQFGGQITISHEVVNYPGVGRCSGKELTDTMFAQAKYFGAEFLKAEALRLETDGDVKKVYTNHGEYRCLGVLVATGAKPRKIGFPGEEEYKGRGVAYCATCDGEFFTGKEVFVVGGGYAAAEESIFLTKFAKHVTILIREDDFTCAKSLADSARNHEKISVITNTIVEKVTGDDSIKSIFYKDINTGKVTEFKDNSGENIGVFVFAGYEPETSAVKNKVSLNEQGYIITDGCQCTDIPGVYAAGDVCIKPLRQVVTATGDGALAATELEKYVAKLQDKTGLKAKKPKMQDKTDLKGENSKISESDLAGTDGEVFSDEIKTGLEEVFKKMETPLLLKLCLDNRPVSKELKIYIEKLVSMTDKLSLETDDNDNEAPCVRICDKDGEFLGLAFHGVPGGHEFTSFVLGLYNASGPGQTLDENIKDRIQRINKKINVKILVSLSCTMCPDLVVAAQHMAAVSKNITAEVYDIQYFEDLKNKYKVMSVPCLIINDEHVYFGKKDINKIMDIVDSL